MALILDGIKRCKIKMQIIRGWEAKKKESSNSVEMFILESSGTRIHTTIDEDFSRWIEKINETHDGEADIDIPKDLLTVESRDPIKRLLREVYGESFAESYNPAFCQDRALLCPTSADVDQINDFMLSLLPGVEKFCHSDDCIPANDDPDPKDFMLLSPVFFGTCIVPGVPAQILRLKVGAPVVLLMDVDPSRGLCRGTRLQITRLGETMIETKFATCSSNDVDKVLIPKMHMSPTKENLRSECGVHSSL